MLTKVPFYETQYGFIYGAAHVTRVHSDHKKGWAVMQVATPKIVLQIYVTKTGKMRLHVDGEEVPLPPGAKRG